MVPVYWLLPNDLLLPIHIALTMLALVGIITGWLVYLIARHLATPWHGVVAAAIWMLDPRVIGQNLNGLETGIAVLGMAATAYWYLSRIRDHTQIPLWRVAVLGVLAGLTILTRVDQVVFVGALGLDYLIKHRNWRVFWNLTLVGIIVALIYTPWLVLGWSIGASIIPESGAAVRLNAQGQAAGSA
ncbi:MAG: DUF2079 domain-containing protein, partial [Chloroflexaceae bacterium]|nr:DUF2079 domain-containing protein [Chloroflexaceae bacterium]